MRRLHIGGVILTLSVGVSIGSGSTALALGATVTATWAARQLWASVDRLSLLLAWGAVAGGLAASFTALSWWVGLLVPSGWWVVVSVREGRPRGWDAGGRRRRAGVGVMVLAVGSSVVGAAVLTVYFSNVQTLLFAPVDVSGVRLPLVVVVAVVNGVVEEVLWRGACLSVLAGCTVRPAIAVPVQAASFGLAHLVGGFPSGWTGVALTSAFGVSQGALLLLGRSLLPPVLVHVWLDVVVVLNLL